MKTLPFLLLLLVVQTITAQKLSKDDLSEKLADKACECANKKELNKDNFEVSLGLCINESLGGYSKDVEKYDGNNAITNEEKLEELAANIGVKMATKCPKIFNMLSFDDQDSEEEMEEETEEESLMISGKVTEIKQDQFITFSVKESSGKMNHFILLGDFDNAFLLTDKVLKVADEAEFYYYELDLYDAKLGRFVLYNIISDIIKK